ncbi:uncharacterized protein LOC143252148 isoform X1 [Tachypleus tridentatus]|uniref:uncharacterized protein LOC143252148 isoform X1 n=1 Tax=Tachypleus tridentatus TaxID=6853 RepID=UPI003FCEFB7E
MCTCFPGYTGIWCDQCASGYFLDKKMCKDCPCTNTTSSGKCILDESGEVKCESCLAGHRGHFCSSCTAGYRWNNISCVPLNCLSFTLCMKQMDHPGCSDCIYLMDSLSPPTAQKSSERTIADGTVPLIAVIVTLGIILLVAAGATCYRSWVHWRARPRLPLWEMELGEVKNTLGYHSICKINDNNIHHISSEVEEEDLTDYTHSAVS